MSPMPFHYVAPDPTRYRQALLERRDAIKFLCQSLENYLALEVNDQLRQLDAPPTPPSIEDLDQAQREVERIAAQLNMFDRLSSPSEARTLPPAIVDFINASAEPLRQALQAAEHHRDAIQHAIEAHTMKQPHEPEEPQA